MSIERKVSNSSLRRVVILADESANWIVAGLRQLDRVALSLREFNELEKQTEPLRVFVFWRPGTEANRRWLPNGAKLEGLTISDCADEFLHGAGGVDLIISTRLFLHRNGIPHLLPDLPATAIENLGDAQVWSKLAHDLDESVRAKPASLHARQPWDYLSGPADISAAERRFLRESGKSQDGLVSRHLNRPLSRSLSIWLLKLPITPSAWSISIFILPLCATFAFLGGTYKGFITGAVIFQIYSIIDGCDGEIARAKFMQTEFGRRLDSLCDLIGNLLLALSLGLGLALQAQTSDIFERFYIGEGIAAALLIVLSEGIVFARRSRTEIIPASATRWNGALYQRHHEFLERSGILFFGERFAWWLVQLTKRDMAMLAFLFLAIVGHPAWILHLLLLVSGVSAALASNAFLRQPAPAVPQEAN